MSLRIDTSELIAGAYIVGETGLGVLAENIPASGLDGASFLYNDLSLPADNGKEIRGLIVTPPASGTFYAWEDGSFSLVGAADGPHTFTYRLFVDGVDQGTADGTITVGVETESTMSGSAALDDIAAAGALVGSTLSELSGEMLLADVIVNGVIQGFSANRFPSRRRSITTGRTTRSIAS